VGTTAEAGDVIGARLFMLRYLSMNGAFCINVNLFVRES
jgi:hypothetical protein